MFETYVIRKTVFWIMLGPPRAIYFAFKADLKARVFVHQQERNYQCNSNLGFVL